ncbi:enoyl-CoA hydratase/isomerase family protein [Ramlibacter sp.]|uniref:enoyl-CoA hydratase/isomerase family protein n=1 Tax=Ramlibacter sp. TaxID=1917967 RepID=UPI003D0C3745
MSTNRIETRTEGGAARILLNRADAGNAVDMAMLQDLTRVLREAAANTDVRLVVLDAAGEDFCLGRDNKGEVREGLSTWDNRERFMQPILDLYGALRGCPQPVVSVVRGRARGFGCALAGTCDVTLASEGARFSLPEIEHGVPPALAMAALHTRVSRKTLEYMVYSAQELSAAEAMQAGIVSRVHVESELRQRADALIDAMLTRPRAVLATVKKFGASVQPMPTSLVDDLAGSLLAIARSRKA